LNHPESELTKRIFGLALDVPADGLDEFLAQQCRGDAALAARVRELIEAHHQAGRFLDPGEDSLAPRADGNGKLERIQWLLVDEQPGSVIDRYRLLEVIGEGGHGTVFRAEQEQPVRRMVALKVIRKGMASGAAKARFDTERQTLASLEHPNIARLFDAGTTEEDRPYFVMELVPGIPITRYCDQRRSLVRLRVGLFITVCRAIQYAHQKGIIHRDLKPANILVADADGLGYPKVIDFGVSRLASPLKNSDEQVQVLGTPQYMSPEQVMSNDALDTRSDVYSLGAILYELLTGVMVMDTNGRRLQSPSELRELFQSHPPRPPSERLRSLAGLPLAETQIAGIATNRTTLPAQLVRSLKEDLDWIVMKAIHRDRAQRYDSAAALADDLQRHLDGWPVLAAPQRFSYVLRRFGGRHKTAAVFSLLICLTVLLSLSLVSAALIQTRAARDRAVASEQIKARAEASALSRLKESYLEQAKARARSRVPGQRTQSLNAIALASQLAPSPELRNVAIFAMSLPDAELLDNWDVPQREQRFFFDGKMDRYALADMRGRIRILQTSDRSLLTELPASGGLVSDLSYFSPDGKYFAAYFDSPARSFQIWNVAVKQPVFNLPYWPASSFSNDSKLFAADTPSDAIHPSGAIHLLSLPSFQITESIEGGGGIGEAQGIRFNPENNTIAVWGNKPGLRLVPLDSALPARRIDTGSGLVRMVGWNPDGDRIAVSTDPAINRIVVFDAATGESQTAMDEHIAIVVDLAFSRDGRFLFSGGWDGAVRMWNAATGTEQLSVGGFGGSLQMDTDSARFGFGGGNHQQLWRLTTSDEYRALNIAVQDGEVIWCDTSPDGSLLAFTTDVGIRIRNLQTGKQFCFLSLPGPRSVLFSPDGTQLFASFAYGVRHWKITDLAGRCDSVAKRVIEGSASAMAASRDFRTIVFGTPDGAYSTLRVGNPDQLDYGLPLGSHISPPRFIAVSPDGAWAATSSRYENPKVWDLKSRSFATELPVSLRSTETGQVAFDPSGKILITGDSAAYRWYSVGNWRLLRTLDREPGNIGHVAFSPDGKFLALDGPGSSMMLADPAGNELGVFDTPITYGSACNCFTRDSHLLISTGAYSLSLWDLPRVRSKLASMNLDWH